MHSCGGYLRIARMRRFVWLAAAFVLFALPVYSVAQQPEATVFGTVKIKKSWSTSHHHMESDDQHFMVRSWTLRQVIEFAYGLSASLPMEGAPEWVDTTFYDIDARVGPPGTGLNQARVGQRGRGDEYPAVEALLRDRFGLVAHLEPRPILALALVVAKDGARLKTASATRHSKPGIYDGPVIGVFDGKSATMPMLAGALRRLTPTPLVYDFTNLTGAYDFTFHWDALAEMQRRIGPLPFQSPNPSLGTSFGEQCERGQIAGGCEFDSKVPALTAALREELGLELRPLPNLGELALVIERISRPPAD